MRPGDLDDPTPLEPDDTVLERVHTRSGALRHRRHLRRLTGAGAAALVVVLAVVVATAVPVGDNGAEPNRPTATTTTTPGDAASDLEGTWKPVSIAGYDGPLARLAVRARLTFVGDGKLFGSDGCNGFTGSYQLGTDASFEVADFGQTLIGCDDQLPIQQTLGATARVDVSDDQLTLLAVDGRELAEFVRPTVTAHIELPSDTMVAGTTMEGTVVVRNDSGAALEGTGCGSYFQVLLVNDDVQQEPGWRSCLQQFTFPVGESRHRIIVAAHYNMCVGGAGVTALPTCRPGGGPPPLAVGEYRATLYQSGSVVPDHEPVPVTVVRADEETADFATTDLERALVDAGYDVTDDGTAPGSPLAATARLLCVNGTRVSVYEHTDDAARREVSDGISADGSTIGRGNARTIVDWIGPPHFYARGRILALVLQDDTALLRTLSEIMGPTISPEAYRAPRVKSACG